MMACTNMVGAAPYGHGRQAVGFFDSIKVRHLKATPNPSVNRDAPVRVFLVANDCGGAPVT
jgi:hypothetical protein